MNPDKTNVFQALIKRDPDFLDRPLADLLPLRFMGEVAVNAYRGLIKRLNDLPLSMKEKESRLKDGQDAGKALLMIEARIGELLPPPEETYKASRPEVGSGGKSKRSLPGRMTGSQAYRARAIASHPAEVAEVIREAEENEDIPTKTAVLNKIAYKQEKARTKGQREKTQIEMAADAYLYYTRLEDALRLIPTTPPRELKEKDFLQIKAVALLIIKRLEVFNGTQSEGSARSDRRLSQGKR
jgi:hypothetical protein